MQDRAIISVDPGTTTSALLLLSGDRVDYSRPDVKNAELLREIMTLKNNNPKARIVVEVMVCMGQMIGKDTIETCYLIGSIFQVFGRSNITEMDRRQVKSNLVGVSRKCPDSMIRQALIDRFGGKESAIGNKKKPGPLYGVTSHCWSALALAITARDLHKNVQPGSLA